jgi:hypothetical protein
MRDTSLQPHKPVARVKIPVVHSSATRGRFQVLGIEDRESPTLTWMASDVSAQEWRECKTGRFMRLPGGKYLTRRECLIILGGNTS